MNAPTIDHLPIGWRIARLRRRRGWSQQVLADHIGRSKSWVEKVERGDRRLDRLSTLYTTARALGVPLADLLEEVAPPARTVIWEHAECGCTTPSDPPRPPERCAGCGRWGGNWHQAVTP